MEDINKKDEMTYKMKMEYFVCPEFIILEILNKDIKLLKKRIEILTDLEYQRPFLGIISTCDDPLKVFGIKKIDFEHIEYPIFERCYDSVKYYESLLKQLEEMRENLRRQIRNDKRRIKRMKDIFS